MAPPASVNVKTYGSSPTAHVRRMERMLNGSGGYVQDPDPALAKDSLFWDKCDANASIRGARDFRRHLIAAPRILLKPRTPRDAPLVPYVRALLARQERFDAMVFGLADAFCRGLVVGRMLGDFEEVDLLGDGNVRRYYLVKSVKIMTRGRWQLQRVVEDGQVYYRWALWDFELGRWRAPPDENFYIFHKYQDSEDQLYGRDLGAALYHLAYSDHILDEASLDTAERFGAPWIKVTLNGEIGGHSTEGSAMPAFAGMASSVGSLIAKMRAKNFLVCDDRLKMELITADLRGADFIQKVREEIKNDIRILLLGSNLPTNATSGGSFALASVQDESTRRIVAFDRKLLGETISEQLVARLVMWNKPTLATIPAGDGSGRSMADLEPPIVELADEEVRDVQDRQASLQMAQLAKLRVRRADLHDLAQFEQPEADAPEDEIVDFGKVTAPAPGMFSEHSPVWQKFADGRLR